MKRIKMNPQETFDRVGAWPGTLLISPNDKNTRVYRLISTSSLYFETLDDISRYGGCTSEIGHLAYDVAEIVELTNTALRWVNKDPFEVKLWTKQITRGRCCGFVILDHEWLWNKRDKLDAQLHVVDHLIEELRRPLMQNESVLLDSVCDTTDASVSSNAE